MFNFISFLSGLIFAIGLGISGMTQPQKIIGFLDIFGDWDPTLIFVMISAIAVHSLAYITMKKDSQPKYATQFSIPNKTEITKNLIMGSFLFGAGWGLSGFCPGPGVVSLFSGYSASLYFVGAMILGMAFYRLLFAKIGVDG